MPQGMASKERDTEELVDSILIDGKSKDSSETNDGKVVKYILVTGGVISGIGKGIVASSFGTILKWYGLEVTSIKIDPYINIDAGTFSPYEHGEVFVLDDGGEVDLDLGNYERFLDITLGRDNNITTGKIYEKVINRERKGNYLGKTVQVVPHITDAIQNWVENVANKECPNGNKADVCIIELGGVIGDIEGMPFVEAFRQFQFRVGKENFCLVHISLVPQPRSTGEAKTKPTQSSIRELRSLGLSPDIMVCRSELPLDQTVKEKISNFCHVRPEEVICIHDISSIYEVPILMKSLGIIPLIERKLGLTISTNNNSKSFRLWNEMTEKANKLTEEISIGIVGKYIKLEDAYTSVARALQHAALHAGYRVRIEYIDADKLEKARMTSNGHYEQYLETTLRLIRCSGVVVPGGFGTRGIEGKVTACKLCRERKIPFLGICLGFQAAVIEYARNVLNMRSANTSEVFGDSKLNSNDEVDNSADKPTLSEENTPPHEHVIIQMWEHTGGDMGGTMRLGRKNTHFRTKYEGNSMLFNLYGRKKLISERHRHRYEVNPDYVKQLENEGLRFVATDKLDEEVLSIEKQRMEILELSQEVHPYYVGTQFHPEYTSRPLKPSPPFLGLIEAARYKAANP